MSLDELEERIKYIVSQTEHPEIGDREQFSSMLLDNTLPQLAKVGAIDYDTRTQTIHYHPSPTLEEYAHHSAYQELSGGVFKPERH